MSFRSKLRGSLIYAVTIVGGFLLAYLLVAFVIFPSGVVPGNAKVPNVTGLMFDEASARLGAVGFKAERGDSRFHEASPTGTVLEQSPVAGTHDVDGATITLVTSAGAETARVPSIVGLTRSDAQAALEGAGFDLGAVTEKASTSPPGEVISSNPAPGASVAIPSAVAITLSSGPDVVTGRPQ